MLPTLLTRNHPLWTNAFDLLRGDLARDSETPESYGVYGAYPVDIHEDDNHIYVEAEMPGFKRDEIEVTLEKGLLTISADRKESKQEGRTTHLAQRRYTRISRRFSLPNTVDEAKVDAALADGVLKLTLTKREEVRPRKIEVK